MVIYNAQGTRFMVYTPLQASRMYRIPEKTLSYWRAKGEGPEFFMVGRWVFYTDVKFNEWLKAKKNGRIKDAIKTGKLPFGSIFDTKGGSREAVDAVFQKFPKQEDYPGKVIRVDTANGCACDRRGPIGRFFGRLFAGVNHG